MYKDELTRTLRIKRRLVAIIAVIIALTMVTTISYNACFTVYAVGENETEQTEEKKQTEADLVEEAKKEKEKKSSEDTKTEETEEKTEKETAKEDSDTSDDKKTEDKESEKETADDEKDADKKTDEETEEEADPAESFDVYSLPGLRKPITMPSVTSSSYIVMSGSTSEVVIEHHAQRKMHPGKITMLMTAMVVIDNLYNDDELNNVIEIDEKLAQYGKTFKEGDSVTVENLLKAMLVGGSKQAAEALSRYSASKRRIFIRMMNSKAMELGLMDTNFKNPTGAYNTGQYSTAADCAVITQAALRYQFIKDALALPTIEMPVVSNGVERVEGFRSTNPLLLNADQTLLYTASRGGIRGTAGSPVSASQFAGVALKDDMQLVVVLMDSKVDKIAYEAKGLFEFGNTLVTRNVIVKENKRVGTAIVRGGAVTRVPAYTETKGFAYVPPEGSEALIETDVVMNSNLQAPLSKGDKVGEYRIYVADELKGTVDLVVRKDVPKGWILSDIYISNKATIAIGVVLFLILLFFLRVWYVKAKRKRIKKARRERRLREIARQQMEIDEDRRRRDWTYTAYYDSMPPRTGDLRKEAEKSSDDSSRKMSRRQRKKQIKMEQKRAAAAKRAEQKRQNQQQ